MCLLVEGLNGLISPKTVRYTGRNCHIQKQSPRNPARLPADEEQDATAELEDHRQDGRHRRQRKVPFREITDRDPEAHQFHVAQINEQKRHQDAASQEYVLGVITVIRAAVELWCIRVCAHNPPLRCPGLCAPCRALQSDLVDLANPLCPRSSRLDAPGSRPQGRARPYRRRSCFAPRVPAAPPQLAACAVSTSATQAVSRFA